jgi:hypothetical protein
MARNQSTLGWSASRDGVKLALRTSPPAHPQRKQQLWLQAYPAREGQWKCVLAHERNAAAICRIGILMRPRGILGTRQPLE